MRKRGFLINGVRIRPDGSVPVCLAALLFADASVSTLLCLLAAVLHELGHFAALKAVNCPVKSIRVCPFGAVIDANTSRLSIGEEAAVFAAGIAVNLTLFGVCFPLAEALRSPQLLFFAISNGVLGLINLCPCGILDGGRLLHLLFVRFLPPDISEQAEAVVSDVALLLLTVLSLRLISASGGNFSLLIFCVALFLSQNLAKSRILTV